MHRSSKVVKMIDKKDRFDDQALLRPISVMNFCQVASSSPVPPETIMLLLGSELGRHSFESVSALPGVIGT